MKEAKTLPDNLDDFLKIFFEPLDFQQSSATITKPLVS